MKKLLFTLIVALSATVVWAQQQPGVISGSSGWVSTVRQTAPVIRWQHPRLAESEQKNPTLQLTACVQSVEPLTYRFYQNGREIPARRSGLKRIECGRELAEEITLERGRNEVYLTATNPAGTTTTELRYVTYTPDEPPVRPLNEPKRIALVVGNANYPKSGLRNSVNDGRAVKGELEKIGFRVLYGENLTKQGFAQLVDAYYDSLRFQKVSIGVIFYAGHGLMVAGQNYVQPVDADPITQTDVEYDCYPLGKLLGRVEQANKNGANLVFWDACRTNPYRSWTRDAADKGAAPANPPAGTVVVFAAQPGKPSIDGVGQNGLFTGELIKHIRKPEADVYELVRLIGKGIRQSGFDQPPYIEGYLPEPLYLAR